MEGEFHLEVIPLCTYKDNTEDDGIEFVSKVKKPDSVELEWLIEKGKFEKLMHISIKVKIF
jgi:hypothetical protein